MAEGTGEELRADKRFEMREGMLDKRLNTKDGNN